MSTILQRIDDLVLNKPDLVVLKLTISEARALYDWLQPRHPKIPPFEQWIASAVFFGRKIEIYDAEDTTGGV